MLSAWLSAWESTMGSPVPTPKGGGFVWLVSLNGSVIPPHVRVGDVCKGNDRNKLVVTQNMTGNEKTDVTTVFKDVVSKINLLSKALVKGGDAPDEVLDFVEVNGDEEDRLNLLRFCSRLGKGVMRRFSSVFLRLKTSKATRSGLEILRAMKKDNKNSWDLKDVTNIVFKVVREGHHSEYLTELLAKAEIGGGESKEEPQQIDSNFSIPSFLETLNNLLSLSPPSSSPPLTNVMLCSCLLHSFVSGLRNRLMARDSQIEQSMFLELTSMLTVDKLPMLALDECCVQCARGRVEKYGKEMEMRLRGDSEGQTELLRIFLDEVGGAEKQRPGEVEDKLLLTTLLIHHAVDLPAPSLSLSCGTIPRLVGEVEGDWERLEDAKRNRWGWEEEWKEEGKEDEKEAEDEEGAPLKLTRRENRDMKTIKEHPRIRTCMAIRAVSGSMLLSYLRRHSSSGKQLDPDLNPDLTPSLGGSMHTLSVALNLLRSPSTSTKAAGMRILQNLPPVSASKKAKGVFKAVLETSYKAGGAARIDALNYLASQTAAGAESGGDLDTRGFLLDCGAINVVASLLEAAVKESVGEERFYVEREAIWRAISDVSGQEAVDDVSRMYMNNKETRGEIERHCVRILIHMKVGGYSEEVERRVENLENLQDEVASELFMTLVRGDEEDDY